MPVKNFAAVVLLLRSVAGVAAQGPAQVIPDRPACPNCRIERYLVATLSDDSIPALGLFTMVTVTADRRFLITRIGESTPFVADRNGKVMQQIGRAGTGPGEYQMPQYSVETGSGYVIFDQRNRRLSRLSKAFRFESSVPFPSGQIGSGAVVFGDGRYVMNAAVNGRGAAAHPLHVVSREGKIVRSFGGDATTASQIPDLVMMLRRITLAADSTIWIAHDSRYRIERWDTTGKLISVLERRAAWFPQGTPGRAETRIMRIHADQDGHLWVHISVHGSSRFTVVEVLDPQKRQLIASLRINDWGADPAYGGLFMKKYRESEIGEPRIDIWGFRLHRPVQSARGARHPME